MDVVDDACMDRIDAVVEYETDALVPYLVDGCGGALPGYVLEIHAYLGGAVAVETEEGPPVRVGDPEHDRMDGIHDVERLGVDRNVEDIQHLEQFGDGFEGPSADCGFRVGGRGLGCLRFRDGLGLLGSLPGGFLGNGLLRSGLRNVLGDGLDDLLRFRLPFRVLDEPDEDLDLPSLGGAFLLEGHRLRFDAELTEYFYSVPDLVDLLHVGRGHDRSSFRRILEKNPETVECNLRRL